MLKRSLLALCLAATAVPVAHAEESPQAERTEGATTGAPAVSSDISTATLPDAKGDAPVAASAVEPRRDAAPAAAEPDPLTPKPEDDGPRRAPGAPEQPLATERATSPADPVIGTLRSRIESKAAPRDVAERSDLDALKSFYGGNADRLWTDSSGLTSRATAALAALERADEWGLDASAFTLPARPGEGALTETLIEAEIAIGLAVLKYARHARGGRTDPPSLSKMIDMRPRLYEPRSVLEALASAADTGAYLEGLNPRHPGFLALKDALARHRADAGQRTLTGSRPAKGAHVGSTDIERRILVNMERWRWLPDDLGSFHVWDNVPEQVTRVLHDGKVLLKEKIVVGKPDTPTPMFSAPMRFVIFHPSWGVPEGIKSNELAPMLRRAQANSSGWFFSDNDGASRALRRHELRVFQGGREINPDRVNWASVDVRQFSFQQPPSAKNVLGVVKFRFPNKFDVYMHDTSERHLFSRAPRTFSHGCMRVENPLKLAEVILSYDKGWGRERIQQMVARGGTTDVTLDKKVPVHIVYFTAAVDENGKLNTFSDIYGIDSRVASALAGRSVAVASARSEVEERPAGATRKEAAAKKAVATKPKPTKTTSGEAFNPFSGLSAN